MLIILYTLLEIINQSISTRSIEPKLIVYSILKELIKAFAIRDYMKRGSPMNAKQPEITYGNVKRLQSTCNVVVVILVISKTSVSTSGFCRGLSKKVLSNLFSDI